MGGMTKKVYIQELKSFCYYAGVGEWIKNVDRAQVFESGAQAIQTVLKEHPGKVQVILEFDGLPQVTRVSLEL
jgi:hypothetical protein